MRLNFTLSTGSSFREKARGECLEREMSVIDLIERVDAICRRYEKYDLDNHNEALGSQYDVVEAGIEASLQKLEAATTEEDRAFDVAMKADVQQTKAYLLEEVSELQKLTLERVNVLSKEEFVAQNNLISMLKERIEAISDGIARGAKQTGDWATSASHGGIKIGSTSDKRFGSNYCQQTEESIRFRQGNEMQKMKQASVFFLLILFFVCMSFYLQDVRTYCVGKLLLPLCFLSCFLLY